MSGFVRTFGEPPKISRGGKVSRAGHVIEGAKGIVIGSGGEGSARISNGSARNTAAPLPNFYPELENPTYKVELGHTAGKTIREDIAWTLENVGDVETGGWLLAAERNLDFILQATVPGSDSSATRSSINLGSEQVIAAQRKYGDKIVGAWHWHGHEPDVPSETDLRAFARGARAAGGRWIELIATTSRTWRPEPEISGWVTFQPGTPGVLITERLRLVT